jgi:hypothetical protein
MVEPLQNKDNAVFLSQSRKGDYRPQNEYEHGHELINSELEESSDKITMAQSIKFSSLVNKHIQTANLGPDNMVRMYQNDVILLTYFLDFAKRNEGCASPFFNKFHGWRGEILTTKTKNGVERILQAMIGTNFQANQQGLGAFGSQIEAVKNATETDNFLGSILKKKNKQQG